MDSCDEFIKNIKGDMLYILRWFDAIIALYNLVGKYQFLDVRAETDEGDIVFILQSNNMIDISSLMRSLDSTCITIFSRTYSVDAFYDLETNSVTVHIKGIPI